MTGELYRNINIINSGLKLIIIRTSPGDETISDLEIFPWKQRGEHLLRLAVSLVWAEAGAEWEEVRH